MNGRRDDTLRITLSALLIALMLVLGYVESMLPPLMASVPGIKIGLSNGVLIFAVYMLDIPTAYILMTLKVTLSGLLFSGVSAMIYAFAGGLISLTLMALLSRFKKISPIAVSMAGGVAHNAGQVMMAMIVLHTPVQMLYYLGVLTVVGLACGALTGVAASSVMKYLKAGHVRLSVKRTVKGGAALILAAALLTAGGVFWAYRSYMRTVPVAAAPVETVQSAPTLIPGNLPFALPSNIQLPP